MVALSPGLILAAYINWDLFAMALTACGLAAWAARRPGWPGCCSASPWRPSSTR